MNIIDYNIKLENQLNEALGLLTQSMELAKGMYARQVKADEDYKTLAYAYNELQKAFERLQS